ncbi:MAG: class I SAM-dependent methyltransferase [Chloroflexi bacterium]|nr:class I SAM-dependent methyltransferase [Chloroflexota bacterium]
MTQEPEERSGHHWQEPKRVAEYIDRTDQIIAERAIAFDLMTKLVPAEADASISVLDVGSGHGIVASFILEAFPNARAIGLDISDAMMDAGRQRMAKFGDRFRYVVGDFADGVLPAEATSQGPFDLVVSARAIHHLPAPLMATMYASIFQNLKPGGAFFNTDTASPDSGFLQDMYRKVSRIGRPARTEPSSRSPEQQAHDSMLHHKDATVLKHYEWLTAAGFTSVDCFWKKLNLALIGGYKKA